MTFQEIQDDPDVCANCFRKLRDRYERNYRVETFRKDGQTKLWLQPVDDMGHDVYRRPQDTIKIPQEGGLNGMVTVCECGYRYTPDRSVEWRNRPLDKRDFFEYAENLYDRLDEAGVKYDRDELEEELSRIKSRPDMQKKDDLIYEKAIDNVGRKELIADGGQMIVDHFKGTSLRVERLDKPETYYFGKSKDEVPQIPHGRFCNIREFDDDGHFVGYCTESASTNLNGGERGPCKEHSKPLGNGSKGKHNMNSDPLDYKKGLTDKGEQDFIRSARETILDRLRKKKDPDFLDAIVAERIATRLHIAAKASEHVNEEGITETVFTEHGQHEKENPVLSELRRYDNSIVSDLKDLGVLDDPETQKADALKEWTAYIDNGN